MVATTARMGMGGPGALLAAIEASENRARLMARLYAWGEYQREGYDLPGIDYARPRVVGNAPGSRTPAPDGYLSLCAAISLLPHADAEALRRRFVLDQVCATGRAVAALLADGFGEKILT